MTVTHLRTGKYRIDTRGWNQLLTDSLTVPGSKERMTEGPLDQRFDWSEWRTPVWSARTAFLRLGVKLDKFPDDRASLEVMGGFARGALIGLNPRCRKKIRVVAHELAHFVHGHTFTRDPDGQILRQVITEFEAECTAILVSTTLTGDDGHESRLYIQEYVKRPTFGNLPTSWEVIKAAGLKVIKAGLGTYKMPPKKEIVGVKKMKINWGA